jgi:hypothetical protein
MEMQHLAEAYCRVVEAAEPSQRMAFLNEIAVTLSAALSAGYRLSDPDLDVDALDRDIAESISSEQWQAQLMSVQRVVDDLVLADALTDIWKDLRKGLDALARGVALDEVTWEWRFAFWSHWGAHAVDALQTIHPQLDRPYLP